MDISELFTKLHDAIIDPDLPFGPDLKIVRENLQKISPKPVLQKTLHLIRDCFICPDSVYSPEE